MQIESIIRRNDGTDVVLGKKRYQFRPVDPSNPGSPHVATVTDKNHIRTLLGITEGYQVYVDTDDSDAQGDVSQTVMADPNDNGPVEKAAADQLLGEAEAAADKAEYLAAAQKQNIANAESKLAAANAGVSENAENDTATVIAVDAATDTPDDTDEVPDEPAANMADTAQAADTTTTAESDPAADTEAVADTTPAADTEAVAEPSESDIRDLYEATTGESSEGKTLDEMKAVIAADAEKASATKARKTKKS